MKQENSVQQSAPEQVSIAALASIYRVSEIDIARQLQNQGCSQIIEKPESIDAQALYDRLHHYQQDYLFDFSSVPTFFIAEHPEMTIETRLNCLHQVQVIDLLGLFQTLSNSGFVEFHKDYATA